MRTAPPTDPGIPTRNSRPPTPAAAACRATTGSGTAPPASTVAAAASTVSCSNVAGQHDGQPGEPVVGHEQVRAAPDHEHRNVLGKRGRDRAELVEDRDAHDDRGRTAEPVGRQLGNGLVAGHPAGKRAARVHARGRRARSLVVGARAS